MGNGCECMTWVFEWIISEGCPINELDIGGLSK